MVANKRAIIFILLFALLFAAACSGSNEPAADRSDSAGAANHGEDNAHEDDHDDSVPHGRIPNENGARIRITSPADGALFQYGAQVIVEVEAENFDLNQPDNHWHVFVNGSSWGMVMGGNTDQPLSGLDPGEHEISVYLSIPSHEEYEDGDTIHITVTE